MATPPPPNMDGGPTPAVAQPPGTDLTGICFQDQLWLKAYPLDANIVFDYFAISPFYDWTCNNEQLRQRATHPLDLSHLSKMTGLEYVLVDIKEPHLFVIRKQRRDSPEKVTPLMTYYVMDGSIYQAPQVCNVFAARVDRAIHHISKAFTTASANLEKIGYVDPENETAAPDPKASKETIDLREFNRVNQILQSLLHKLPPAPPPPPFPEGYVPVFTGEAENGSETQQAGETQQPPVDPIIDQGPAKRMKF